MADLSFKLPNGISILFRPFPHSRVVHCGVIIDAGSRDELPGEEGMAHFIEHMVFKGTKKRRNFHILNYLENVGGDLNAYTTKEKTCLYASLSKEYFHRAAELLADITFHSTFPAAEISKEKLVINEEIDMYKDNPEEAIFEDFDECAFPKHALGRPILGTKASISGFNQKGIKDFLRKHYTSRRIVFAVAGPLTPEEVKSVATKYFSKVAPPEGRRRRHREPAFSTFSKEVLHSNQQAHQIIGGPAYALRQGKNYIPFYLLNNHLGGPGMNSLLNYRIREKHGLSYNIYSFYSPYSDSGLWGVYYGCEPQVRERIMTMVMRELDSLRQTKPGTVRLSQMKKQLIGQMTLAFENPLSQMLSMAKNHLDFGKDWTMEDIAKEIESVTPSQVLEAANEIFSKRKLSTLAYIPGE